MSLTRWLMFNVVVCSNCTYFIKNNYNFTLSSIYEICRYQKIRTKYTRLLRYIMRGQHIHERQIVYIRASSECYSYKSTSLWLEDRSTHTTNFAFIKRHSSGGGKEQMLARDVKRARTMKISKKKINCNLHNL